MHGIFYMVLFPLLTTYYKGIKSCSRLGYSRQYISETRSLNHQTYLSSSENIPLTLRRRIEKAIHNVLARKIFNSAAGWLGG